MTKREDDFYIGYLDGVSSKTAQLIKKTLGALFALILMFATAFSLTQQPFGNGEFEISKASSITGVYHENPYPMLRIQFAENTYKNVVLLGFGKFGAKKYFNETGIQKEDLINREMTITGNLIYYNGKTLLQIADVNDISISADKLASSIPLQSFGSSQLEGEIIDPKCYFGVMKPGKGKIHRSCAARCISGGIPPVFASTNEAGESRYYLMCDLNGQAINKAVLPYVGQPAILKGTVEKYSDSWYRLKTDVSTIQLLNKNSTIY